MTGADSLENVRAMAYQVSEQWKLAAEAVKSFTGVANKVVEFIRGLRTATPSMSDQSASLDSMIAEAEKAAGAAQVRILQALGYELCHCAIPPHRNVDGRVSKSREKHRKAGT